MEGNGSNASGHSDTEEQRVYMYTILFIVNGLLALIGIMGNIISFFTFGKMPRNATTFLLRGLAIIDSSFLLLTATAYAMLWAGCRSALTSLTLSYVMASTHIACVAVVWTSVIIGMNRYIAVCRPLQAARLCTTSRARKELLCIILFSIAYALPRFFRNKLTKSVDGSKFIVTKLIDNMIWYKIFYIIGCEMAFRFVIPFALLLFFSVRLITALREARKQALDFHGGRRVDNKVTLMLVTLILVFLICNAPNFIHNLLRIILMNDSQFSSSWTRTILSHIADVLVIFNSSCNWVIYFAYMQDFRKKQCQICIRRCAQSKNLELVRSTFFISSWFSRYLIYEIP